MGPRCRLFSRPNFIVTQKGISVNNSRRKYLNVVTPFNNLSTYINYPRPSPKRLLSFSPSSSLKTNPGAPYQSPGDPVTRILSPEFLNIFFGYSRYLKRILCAVSHLLIEGFFYSEIFRESGDCCDQVRLRNSSV